MDPEDSWHEEALFDTARDPGCFENLLQEPAYASVVQEMRKKLQEWRVDTADPFLDPDLLKAVLIRVEREGQARARE